MFKPEEIYKKVQNRRAGPGRSLGQLLAVNRWRWLPDPPHPRKRYGPRRLQPRPVRRFRTGVALIDPTPNQPPSGAVEADATLLDIALPTLLELGGYDRPPSMQGRSLLVGRSADAPPVPGYSDDDERIVRDRLSGLGYIG